MRRQARPRLRSDWESLVREWRASGLTQKEFARKRGIAASTLSWWSCRLRRVGGAALVPVRVIGGAPGGGADFRVELEGGRTLHVPASFDEGAL
ncbi:MAG: IS66 family insertion sequence element accessory protein TnpA, partial [Planctomycetaceae bacterium]